MRITIKLWTKMHVQRSAEVKQIGRAFLVIPFYLQSVVLYSADCVKTYTMACTGMFSRNHL
jgi:hypothetical protein